MSLTTGRPAPVLYLDVDGPIAPSGGQPSYAGPVRYLKLGPGRMHFPIDTLERLVTLHERGIVRIEWLTSWEEEAPRDLAPALGLPVWPFHTRRGAPKWYECPVPTDWWKERVVVAALEAGERVIWCDDEIGYRADHATLTYYTDRLLPICPDGATGLTLSDLDAIEDWAGSRL